MLILFSVILQGGCSFSLNQEAPAIPLQQTAKPPLYELYYENGTQFLRFTEEGLQALSTPHVSVATPFSSVAEMKQSIESGLLPEDNLYLLYNRSKDGETIAITDLAQLHDIQLPSGVILDYVTWSGDLYTFHFSKGETTGFLKCMSADSYQQYYEQYFVQEPNVLKGDVEILSDHQLSDRNVREIRFNDLDIQNNRIDCQRKLLIYSVPVGDDIRYLYESYIVGVYFDDTFIKDSEDVPKEIIFCGTSNGAFFYGRINDPVEKPTSEWLSSIFLKKYTADQS